MEKRERKNEKKIFLYRTPLETLITLNIFHKVLFIFISITNNTVNCRITIVLPSGKVKFSQRFFKRASNRNSNCDQQLGMTTIFNLHQGSKSNFEVSYIHTSALVSEIATTK
jgi:hypothetical protein